MSEMLEDADRGSRPSLPCGLDAAILKRLGKTLRELYEPLLHEAPDARIASLLQAIEDLDGGGVGWPAAAGAGSTDHHMCRAPRLHDLKVLRPALARAGASRPVVSALPSGPPNPPVARSGTAPGTRRVRGRRGSTS